MLKYEGKIPVFLSDVYEIVELHHSIDKVSAYARSA